jgi:hypothetical protein
MSVSKAALAKGILDAVIIELHSAGNGLLAENSLQVLERRCAMLCADHLSLDRSELNIVRAGVSASRKNPLRKGKRFYAVAFSITSDNHLFRFTLYDGAKGNGFDALEPKFEKMTDDRKVFSVFFQVTAAAEPKDAPVPQIVIIPNKEDQHHAAHTL